MVTEGVDKKHIDILIKKVKYFKQFVDIAFSVHKNKEIKNF